MWRKTHSLLLLLLLAAPLRVEATGLRAPNFTHHRGSDSWREAQAYCRRHYTDLVTIRDQQEDREVFTGQGWIGLHRDDPASEWKWSRGGETAGFTSWANSERDRYLISGQIRRDDQRVDSNRYTAKNKDNKKNGDEPVGGENCAYKLRGRWYGDDCGERHSFMCYDQKLVLVREEKTWEEALLHCRTLEDPGKPATARPNHRYDLASLLTPDDRRYARQKTQRASTDEVWTGLRFLAGRWFWVGGEEVLYQRLPGCPAQRHCGILGKIGTRPWGVTDCMERKNFLCYRKSP
ncbi:uncharacterized protein LOC144539536 [Centroberyx gerrardi]